MTSIQDWENLKVFGAVAREGSLTAAARDLKSSQPTVGRRLRALEDSMEVRLFDRLPEGLRLTQAGEQLLPLVQQMEGMASALDRQKESLAETVSGSVRISLAEWATAFVVQHSKALKEVLPDVSFELAGHHLLANLSRREADLAIKECSPDYADVVTRKLGEFTHGVYGQRAFLERQRLVDREQLFATGPWVDFDEDHAHFPVSRWLANSYPDANRALRTNNGLILRDSCAAGLGLAILPCFVGDAHPQLMRLGDPISDLQSDFWLLVHRDLLKTPRIRASVDALVDLFKKHRADLAGQPERQAAILTPVGEEVPARKAS
ncbi:LysR family transcriptional regulator [Rhodovibrionaceae bacterium A322]